tara:strand:+ start:5178 stop:5402 length:225 start_codon:yes stop_codon:yes gene_type:complete
VTSYKVVDCRGGETEGETYEIAAASSPENAALQAIGEVLVRSGRRADLRVRVYFQHPDQALSMVRLYAKAIDRA